MFPSKKMLDEELEWAFGLYHQLEEEFPVVFTHNDIHMLNIVYNSEKGKFCLYWQLVNLSGLFFIYTINWNGAWNTEINVYNDQPLKTLFIVPNVD